MNKRRKKKPKVPEGDALKTPKLAKKRRYRARWRAHEITYW